MLYTIQDVKNLNLYRGKHTIFNIYFEICIYYSRCIAFWCKQINKIFS